MGFKWDLMEFNSYLMALKGRGHFSRSNIQMPTRCQMCSSSDTTLDHSQRLASWTPPSFGKKEQNDLCDLKCRLKALLHVPYFGLTPVARKRQYSARIFSVPQCLPLYCIWKEFHGFACETLPPSAKAA